MSAKNLSIFVPINKIDEEQRLVYGQVAAGGVVDNSGEMFDYKASKPYFQKWSENAHVTSGGKSKGNLRVMHTSKVAGIVTDLGFDDDNEVIEACAKVIDDNEWNMVKAGAYTGFSMGGRYVSRAEKADANGKTTKTYVADPVEISLVDKPCIPTAVFSVVKADGIVEERHFAESVQSEDGVDLAKAQGRHPKGSSKGGQFAPKNGGSSGAASEMGGMEGGGFNAGPSDPTRGGDGKSKDKPNLSSGVKDGDRFQARGDNWKDAPMTTGFVNGKGTPKEQIDREVKRRVRLASKDEKNGHGSKSDQLRSIAKEDRRIAADRMDVAASKAKAGDTAGAARLAGNAKFYNQLADATEAKAGAAKFDDGDHMYVPTNDEILPVARALAKAAGRSEEDWLDFADQAREDLIAKADGKMHKAEDDEDEAPNTGEPGEEDEHAEEKAEKKDGPPPSVKEKMEDDDEEEEESEEEDDSKAEKSDEPEVEQVWKAKDGTTFAKKADAIAHNQTLAKADEEPSLVDQLRATAEAVDRIAKGEMAEGGEADEDVVEKSDVEQMADALDELVKVDHGGALQKSMYTVERTARALRELASLNICVSREQKAEGKESMLPGEIGIAVGKMGEVLIEMAKEEVEELMATVARDGKPKEDAPAPHYDSYMALAAPILGLAKADLAAKLEETLQKRDPEELPAEALQKIDAAKAETAEALAKAARLESEMAEIAPLVKSLQTQVEQILKMPQPKAPTTVVVGKGDQVEQPGQTPLDLNKFTPDQLADAAFRLAHQHPRHVVIPTGGQN